MQDFELTILSFTSRNLNVQPMSSDTNPIIHFLGKTLVFLAVLISQPFPWHNVYNYSILFATIPKSNCFKCNETEEAKFVSLDEVVIWLIGNDPFLKTFH